ERKLELGTYIGYFVIITILNIFINIPILLMVANLVLFFILTLNYKGSIKKKILTTLLIYLILMSIEIIIVLITVYFNIKPLTRSQYGSILGIIIIRIISYFIVLVIENYKNIRDGDIIPLTYWLCIAIIPIGTLYLSIIIFMEDKMSPIT